MKKCETNSNLLCPNLDLTNAVEGAQEFTQMYGDAFRVNSVAYILRFDDCELS